VHHERHLISTCATAVLVLVTWRVQAIVRREKNTEHELEDCRQKLIEVKRQLTQIHQIADDKKNIL